jgi:hypothetical protein
MKKKTYDDDDGRTIADMSDVQRQPMIVPDLSGLKKEKTAPAEESTSADKPWEESEFSGSERRAFISGALGATMLIASVFIIIGFVVIFLMTKLW